MKDNTSNENEQKYIVRSRGAGVFYARIAERRGQEADLLDARRLHYWTGAASLSQVAMDGVRDGSRLTVAVPSMTVLEVLEVIPVSEKAHKCLEGFPEWKV